MHNMVDAQKGFGMNSVASLYTPLDRPEVIKLSAGERVTLSGEVLVFRDEVHRRLCELLASGEELPFSLKDRAVYYCGPTPARHGMAVGSAGPTTSSRMDKFTGPLLENGLVMTIGKGNRSPEITDLLRKHGAVYMVAVGGTGALIARHIVDSSIIAYEELGTEAARIFTFRELDLIVGIDSQGRCVFV